VEELTWTHENVGDDEGVEKSDGGGKKIVRRPLWFELVLMDRFGNRQRLCMRSHSLRIAS
jgi:hypothetical protein